MNTPRMQNHRSIWGLDLKQLQVAVTAADCGSFRKAAELLRLKQSGLSRSVRQIEYGIGFKIFERSSAGVSPTPAGQNLLSLARMILQEFEALTVAAKLIETNETGQLAIGFCTPLSAGNLQATLLEFTQRFPTIKLAIAERSRTRLATGIRSGLLDVVIVTGGIPIADSKTTPLWAERVLVVLPEEHRLRVREILYWTDLTGETMLTSQYDPGQELENLLIAKLVSPEDRPKIERHYASWVTVNALIRMKQGIGLTLESNIIGTPSGLIYRELRDGLGLSRFDYAAYWRAENQNPALAAFLQMLGERHPQARLMV